MTQWGTDETFVAELRAIRKALGWSLATVEFKSGERLKGVVVASWERGDRHPPVEAVRELLALYGGHRLEILGPDDVVYRSGPDGPTDAEVRYLVSAPGLTFPAADREEAVRAAAAIPFARVGYQLIGPVTYVDGEAS